MPSKDVRPTVRRLLGRVGAIDHTIRRLRRTEETIALQETVRFLNEQLAATGTSNVTADGKVSTPIKVEVSPTVSPFLTLYPPGHFYSPVPDLAEIDRGGDPSGDRSRELRGVDLAEPVQIALFRQLAALARETPLGSTPGVTGRYGTDNGNFGVGDGSMLSAMLRHLQPRQYLEIGSGFTTALAVDVNERYLGGRTTITSVEPYPDLLRSLLREGDPVEIIPERVQTVPLERFTALEADDILFIDSSHVVKTGSDVHFLMTQVVPYLSEGVYVHFHDIFWPFEYPRAWIEEGRAWSEAYLLHAFLLFNPSFEVVLWNHWLASTNRQTILDELPQMLDNPGGSIWLKKTAPTPP